MEDLVNSCCICGFKSLVQEELELHILQLHPDIFNISTQAATNDANPASSDKVPEANGSFQIKAPESGPSIARQNNGLKESGQSDTPTISVSGHQEQEPAAFVVPKIEGQSENTESPLKKSSCGRKKRPQGKFSCADCEAVFAKKGLMSRHAKEVHGVGKWRRKFRCKDCSSKFTVERRLEAHARICHNVGKKKVCRGCKMAFFELEAFKIHKELAHPIVLRRETSCYLCPTLFPTKEALKSHLLETHDSSWAKDLTCEVCDAIFLLRSSLRRHQLESHKLDRVKARTLIKIGCPWCQKSCCGPSAFFVHLQEHHPKIRPAPLNCPLCKVVFDKSTTIGGHYNDFHPERYCKMCDQVFKHSQDLRRHMERETDHLNGQFPCKCCDQKFLTRHLLKQHVRDVHDNKWIDDLRCKTCSEIFLSKMAMVRHVKFCHGRNNNGSHKCNVCEAKFQSPTLLRSHQRKKHLKRKKSNTATTCEDCSKTYGSTEILMKHRRRIHGCKTERLPEQQESLNQPS